MMKRFLALVLAILLVSTSLIGCKKDEGTVVVEEVTTAAEVAADVTTEAAEVVAPELEGTINVNILAAPGVAEAWQAVADGYTALHPKVNVVVDLKPSDGYGDWIQNQFGDANPTADIANVNFALTAKEGKTINLYDYMNMDSPYSDSVWMDQFNYDLQVKDPANGFMDYLSLESVQVLWTYNKDIFKEVGVEPPTTWAEFIAVCEKVDAAGYQALAVPGDFQSFWAMQMGWLSQIYADQTTRSYLDIYRSQEGDYNYDPDLDGAFKLDIADPYNDDSWNVNLNAVRAYNAVLDNSYAPDSEGMKTVMTNLNQAFPKYAGGDAFFGTKDALPLFYQGKAAMFLDGAWRLPSFYNDMKKLAAGEEILSAEVAIEGVKQFELGTFNIPTMEGPGIEAKARTIEVALGSVGAFKKDQAHNDLVIDFLMYYSSTDGYSKYLGAFLQAGGAPAGPSLVYGVELPVEYGAMFDNLSFIGNVQKGFGAMLSRGAPGDVQESLRDWYGYSNDFFNGVITVDQWGDLHKANILKYLPESMAAAKISETDLENPQMQPEASRQQ